MDAPNVGVDRIGGDVELARDLGPRQIRREISQHAEFARAERLGLREVLSIGARGRFASQKVADLGD